MANIKISSIFKTTGQPTITYVKRQYGVYEKRLEASINSAGSLCLLTGPSKTGKTTLYQKVLEQLSMDPLLVRCDDNISTEEFWAKALESINFERIISNTKIKGTEISGGAKLGGTIGWKWLAGLIGEVSLGIKKNMEENEVREKILAKPCPEHLIPALKNLPLILVVEDFHYLSDKVKKTIFQQWKIFIDEEVSVIVIGTTHHAVDLARANKDLVGRISQIEIERWSEPDLQKIAEQGFKYLNIYLPDIVAKSLVRESVGLPIVMQDACRHLFWNKGHTEIFKGQEVEFQRKDVYSALNKVAKTTYIQFEGMYDRLKMGPRKMARKYDTYELILSAFAQDPLVFSLKWHEIGERLNSIKIPEEKRPPAQSINGLPPI